MRKLISMVDFVLEAYEACVSSNTETYKYANFLKQPLEIWQFVPCKLIYGAWVVLKQPIKPEHPYNDKKCDIWEQYLFYLNQYQEAQSRCIFEGFEVKEHTCNDAKFNFIGNNKEYFFSKYCPNDWIVNDSFSTIEDLVKYNLELTASAIKELGL